jgi:group I intron endonuclease
MVIYKIINSINNKVYIGQTIRSLHERWSQHKFLAKNSVNKPLYKAMKKYGFKHFKITEIGGANSESELNYQEWLLIHKNNSLWPHGYNLREGGGNRGKNTLISKKKMSISQKKWLENNEPPRCKKVINIETKQIYKSAKDCLEQNRLPMTESSLRAKLIGKTGNETPFRYVGMEDVCKKPGVGAPKKVINIETGEIYKSRAECAKKNNIKCQSLSDKLIGKNGNETPFRYVGMEDICKKPGIGAPKKVVDIKTGKIYKSASECAKKTGHNYGTLKSKLSGHDKNNTPFQYLDN